MKTMESNFKIININFFFALLNEELLIRKKKLSRLEET